MSDKIKPSEVSEVLQQQLQEVNGAQQFDEVGTVLTVGDGVARIYGLRNAEANELLEFENGTMAIVMNLEEDNVGCVLLGPTAGIKEGQSVKRTHRIASIRVNDRQACILYLCSHRPESIYRCSIGTEPQGARRFAIYYYCKCYRCRSCSHAILRTICWCCYW